MGEWFLNRYPPRNRSKRSSSCFFFAASLSRNSCPWQIHPDAASRKLLLDIDTLVQGFVLVSDKAFSVPKKCFDFQVHIYPSKLGNVPTKKVSCASKRKASLRSCGVFAICRATLALGFAFALALAPAFAFALGSPPDPGAAPWITFTSSCKLGPPDEVEDPLVRASWDI